MRKSTHEKNKNARLLGFLAAAAFVVAIGASSLALAEGTGQYVDDATVTAKVKAALLADSQLKATQVSVTTTQGIVQLSGTVASKDQESEALRATNKIDGVQSVKDMLTVQDTQEQ